MDIQKTDIGFKALVTAIEIEDPIKSIKIYLEIVSTEDEQLKTALNDATKSFDKCWNFINKKAKTHLNSKSGHIAPSVIFGWALHYYIESNEHLEKEIGSSIASNSSFTNPSPTPTYRPQRDTKETMQERLNRIKSKIVFGEKS